MKKNLSFGFKYVEMRELNTSVSAEKKRRYISTWIGKVEIICDGEVLTSGIFKEWQRKGKVTALKGKKLDLTLYNAIHTYLEINTYKYIKHCYTSGIEVIWYFFWQWHGNQSDIKDTRQILTIWTTRTNMVFDLVSFI